MLCCAVRVLCCVRPVRRSPLGVPACAVRRVRWLCSRIAVAISLIVQHIEDLLIQAHHRHTNGATPTRERRARSTSESRGR